MDVGKGTSAGYLAQLAACALAGRAKGALQARLPKFSVLQYWDLRTSLGMQLEK